MDLPDERARDRGKMKNFVQLIFYLAIVVILCMVFDFVTVFTWIYHGLMSLLTLYSIVGILMLIAPQDSAKH